MSDNQEANTSNDPLQAGNIVHEAFQVVAGDTAAVHEEARSLESLAESYQTYVQNYVQSLAQAWDSAIENDQTEVESWRTEHEKAAGAQVPASGTGAASLQEQLETLKQKLVDQSSQSGGQGTAATDSGTRKPTGKKEK